PLMNVNAAGSMCWGDLVVPKGCRLADRAAYEAAVFASNFSHVGCQQTLRLPRMRKISTERHLSFWQEISQQKLTTFPDTVLIPLHLTFGAWLKCLHGEA